MTNEMPFGEWLASSEQFDVKRAENSIRLHDEGLDAIRNLNARIVLSSRPVRTDGKLANEAFALHSGEYRFLHQKHYFPQETGFYEESWFETERTGFEVSRMEDLGVGVLLCTEIMFNERARELGRAGADLIVTPRATGMNIHRWMVAGAMAAIVSGCYVAVQIASGRPAIPAIRWSRFRVLADRRVVGADVGRASGRYCRSRPFSDQTPKSAVSLLRS